MNSIFFEFIRINVTKKLLRYKIYFVKDTGLTNSHALGPVSWCLAKRGRIQG